MRTILRISHPDCIVTIRIERIFGPSSTSCNSCAFHRDTRTRTPARILFGGRPSQRCSSLLVIKVNLDTSLKKNHRPSFFFPPSNETLRRPQQTSVKYCCCPWKTFIRFLFYFRIFFLPLAHYVVLSIYVSLVSGVREFGNEPRRKTLWCPLAGEAPNSPACWRLWSWMDSGMKNTSYCFFFPMFPLLSINVRKLSTERDE